MTADHPSVRRPWLALALVFALTAGVCVTLAVSAARQGTGMTFDPGLLHRWDPDQQLNMGLAMAAELRLQEAREAFERSISLRPRWPAPYVALASLELGLGDLSGLETADKALQLAPNDGHLFVALWPRWLAHWRDLGADRRERILALADRQAGRYPDWTVRRAAQFGQIYTVCDRLALRSQAERACTRWGWSSPDTEASETK